MTYRKMPRTLTLASTMLWCSACGDQMTLSDSGDFSASEPEDMAPPPEESVKEPTPEVIANPFVDTKSDALSTFAADVDSASYDYFRQSVGLYQTVPEPSYVRIEDFVNYFAYDYPTPAFSAKDPFAIDLAASPHPIGRTTTLLRVGIQAKARPEQEKKPANLVFLVDVSGSMQSDDKLPLAQTLLTEALGELEPTDSVSLVTYAGDVSVRLEPTKVSERASIEAAIGALTSGGGTYGAGGLDLAYQQATKGFITDGINHVVLCTDGDFNLGPSTTEALLDLIKQKRATGVTLTALGFGHDNLNDGMMEAVSNAGNGMYAVIYDRDQALEYAHERLLSTLVHVAKDMKIQVQFNPAHVAAYRLIGYEDRDVPDWAFRDDLVDGGEVGAEHRVTALYELVMVGQSVPMPKNAPALSAGESDKPSDTLAADELVRVHVRYKTPTAIDTDPAAETSKSVTTFDLAAEADADASWAAAVATFAEVLRGSPYAQASELDQVAGIVAAQRDRDKDRREFATLFEQARGLLNKR